MAEGPDSGMFSMEQLGHDNQLGRTMRGHLRDAGPEPTLPIEENQDQTFPKEVFPGLPNIGNDAWRSPAPRKPSYGCCSLRCISMVMVVLAVIGGLAITIYFANKEGENEADQGTVVLPEEELTDPCKNVAKEMNQGANFTCNFEHRNVSSVTIQTTTQLTRRSFTVEYQNASNWTIPGPVVNCSTVGRYKVQYTAFDRNLKKNQTYTDDITVNVAGIINASLTGNITHLNISCRLSGDCTNHHLSTYTRKSRSNDTEETKATESCLGTHSEKQGYIKTCFTSGINGTGHTHIGCRVLPRDSSIPEVEFKLSNCSEEDVSDGKTCPCAVESGDECTSQYIKSPTNYTICPVTCERGNNPSLSWCPALVSQNGLINTCTNDTGDESPRR